MKKALNIVFWIIFLISFFPYLYLVKASFFGANVGLFYPNWAYGFEAVYTLICLFTIVPIFPVCLIYEIIYGIIMFRRLGKVRKLITIILPITIILLILIPCTVYEISNRYQDRKFYENNEEYVWEYIHEHYSDEILENARLELRNREDGRFWIILDKDIFNKINYLEITIDKDGNITDYFDNKFKRDNVQDFLVGFGEYVDSYYGMDSSTDLQVMAYNIDLSDYSFSDSMEDVFEKCEYVITSVYFTEEIYDKEDTINRIKEFYKNTMPIIPVEDKQSFNFYVMQNGRFHASIHVYDKNPTDDEITLFISGYHYTNEAKPTIPSENIDITL